MEFASEGQGSEIVSGFPPHTRGELREGGSHFLPSRDLLPPPISLIPSLLNHRSWRSLEHFPRAACSSGFPRGASAPGPVSATRSADPPALRCFSGSLAGSLVLPVAGSSELRFWGAASGCSPEMLPRDATLRCYFEMLLWDAQ